MSDYLEKARLLAESETANMPEPRARDEVMAEVQALALLDLAESVRRIAAAQDHLLVVESFSEGWSEAAAAAVAGRLHVSPKEGQ